MTSPAQINLSILAPSKAVDSPNQLVTPARTGDQPEFDHYLEQEINQPHLERARRKERPETPRETSEPAREKIARADRPEDPAPQARPQRTEARETPAASDSPRPPHKTTAAPSEKITHDPLGTGKPAPTPEEQLIQSLKDLNIDDAQIQTILNTIRQAPGSDEVIEALAGLLGALVAADSLGQNAPTAQKEQQTLAALLQNTTKPTDSAVQLSQQQQRVVNVLVEAGLTRDQAQKLLTAARQGNLSTHLKDIRAQLAGITDDGTVKDSPESKLNLLKSLASEEAATPAPRTLQPEVPKVRAPETAVLADTRSADHSLQKLTDLLGGRPQDTGGRHQDTGGRPQDAGGLKEADPNFPANNTQNPNPVLARHPVPVVQPNGSVTPVKVEGAPAQPLGGMNDSTARVSETAKPAIPENYSPRAPADKPLTQQIIEKFSIRTLGQQKEIFIKLDPPSLGTVRMNVSTAGDHIKTTLVAENQFVKQAIEGNLAQLKDALQGQGVKVDSFTVLVGGHSNGNAPHQRQDGQTPRFFGSQHDLGLRLEGPAESLPARTPVFRYPSQSISVFA